MIPLNYEDNLEKVKHIVNQLDLITNHGMDSLVFNLKNSTCEITYNNEKNILELYYEHSDYPTPETMIFYNTTRIEFYNLMYFITDNIRVTSNIYKEV